MMVFHIASAAPVDWLGAFQIWSACGAETDEPAQRLVVGVQQLDVAKRNAIRFPMMGEGQQSKIMSRLRLSLHNVDGMRNRW